MKIKFLWKLKNRTIESDDDEFDLQNILALALRSGQRLSFVFKFKCIEEKWNFY